MPRPSPPSPACWPLLSPADPWEEVSFQQPSDFTLAQSCPVLRGLAASMVIRCAIGLSTHDASYWMACEKTGSVFEIISQGLRDKQQREFLSSVVLYSLREAPSWPALNGWAVRLRMLQAYLWAVLQTVKSSAMLSHCLLNSISCRRKDQLSDFIALIFITILVLAPH